MSDDALATLNRLERTQPFLNLAGDGSRVDWALSSSALHRLASVIGSSTVSAETGCGVSTLLLGAIGAEHHCFTLLEEERSAILDAANRSGLPFDTVQFHIGDSAVTLPRTHLPPLDVAIVDGAHAFPYPTSDWFFLSRYLKDGGMLLVDDTWIPSVTSLTAFLDKEPQWLPVTADGRTSWYRLNVVEHPVSVYPDGWDIQGINARVARRFATMQALSLTSGMDGKLEHPVLSLRLGVGTVLQAIKHRRKPPPES